MTPTSRGQIWRMLTMFSAAPDVELFDVEAFDHRRGVMDPRYGWTRSKVWKATGWMAARNATGSSIYVRPSRDIETHPWILVDDLTASTLAELQIQTPAGIVVETSPKSFQAWIRIQSAVEYNIRTSIARSFAARYSADPGAVGGTQYGRMPGTTNQKPERRLANGLAPFARLRHSSDRDVAHVEIPAGTDAADAPRQTPSSSAAGNRRPDRSQRDFAIACRLAETGATDAEIAAAIQAVRRDPKSQRRDYIEITIRKARCHVGETAS